MKVLEIISAGSADQLVIRERDTPKAGDGQVLVSVMTVGIGWVDVMMRQGIYPGVDPVGLIPGAEIAGTVSAAGAGVSAEMIGQRVYAICGTGGCAEVVCIDANSIIPLPDNISFEAAVATGLNALVAHFALTRAGVKAGDAVLVRGASGGIGTMAVQLAGIGGANCTAASSKPDLLLSLGAHKIVDRTGGSETFDIVVDPVAGSETGTFFGKLKANGRIVLCGAAGGFPPADFGAAILAAFFASPTLSTLSLNPFRQWM